MPDSTTETSPRPARIGVLGGGAWGTALAVAAGRAGSQVTLWARDAAVVEAINRDHCHPRALPGIALDPEIRASDDPAAAIVGADAVLLAVPSQAVRRVARLAAAHAAPDLPVVICAKGIEAATDKTMVEVVAEELPGRPLAVLSGPSFAADVAEGQPTAVALAVDDAADAHHGPDRSLGAMLALALSNPSFRPYLTDDVAGVEIGGTVKNVIAIACGVAEGLGFGANTKAALITRGLSEITRLGAALGARPETMTGLAGLGDLVLTCGSTQSRNMAFGVALGRGTPLAEALAAGGTVEGAANAAQVVELARHHGVEMPIAETVHAVVNGGLSVEQAVEALTGRPLRAEPAELDHVVIEPDEAPIPAP
ncbi:MAG: NAD(P)H-dependent glycerol-3-phosphate dehydrogenase [Azospirillaceae bacterium]